MSDTLPVVGFDLLRYCFKKLATGKHGRKRLKVISERLVVIKIRHVFAYHVIQRAGRRTELIDAAKICRLAGANQLSA